MVAQASNTEDNPYETLAFRVFEYSDACLSKVTKQTLFTVDLIAKIQQNEITKVKEL